MRITFVAADMCTLSLRVKVIELLNLEFLLRISDHLEKNIIPLKHVYQTKEQDKSIKMMGQTHHNS